VRHQRYKSLRACADDIANHWSVAGLLPGGPGLNNGFVGGLWSGIAGNSVAGISDLYDQVSGNSENTPGNLFGGQLTGNVSQGIPLPENAPAGTKGPVGALLDSSGETGAYIGRIVGTGKFVLDAAIYSAAASFCSTGKY
jgi:hypothetical protein